MESSCLRCLRTGSTRPTVHCTGPLKAGSNTASVSVGLQPMLLSVTSFAICFPTSLIKSDRQKVPDVPAIYFVAPTEENIQRICKVAILAVCSLRCNPPPLTLFSQDTSLSLYDSYHLNFTSSIPRPLLEKLALQTVKQNTVARIAKVCHCLPTLSFLFVALSSRLFMHFSVSCLL